MSGKGNIYLIGPMLSGKTKVGKFVAEKLERHFTDIDRAIETSMGKSIPDIFKEFGELAFRVHETRMLRRASEEGQQWLISTGGGIVMALENRTIMQRNGIVVWLDVDLDILLERQRKKASENKKEGRPLVDKLKVLYLERRPYYQEVANFTIPITTEVPVEEVAQRVLQRLGY